MPPVTADPRLAELALLDVLDVRADGTLALNAAFRAECVARYESDASCLGTVFQARILARAVERGFAAVADVDGLALLALEVAVQGEEPNPSA